MNIGVLGAGTMGHGIAQVAAMAGHTVTLRDVEQEFVTDGVEAIKSNLNDGIDLEKLTPEERDTTLAHLSGTTNLPEAVTDADLVIEAVPEDLDIKRETFQDVEPHVEDGCILATNTSSLSVTEIAAALKVPSRVIGLHFFNPVHIMSLVEVVDAEQTAAEVQTDGVAFVDSLGKTAVEVHDSPGFASSRLGVALGAEAIRMIETDVADPAAIDAAMELGYNHPIGPIELTDVVGLDVRLGVLEYLREELGERFKPPQLLRQKVRAGKLGKKSGEGFYVWEDGEPVSASNRADE